MHCLAAAGSWSSPAEPAWIMGRRRPSRSCIRLAFSGFQTKGERGTERATPARTGESACRLCTETRALVQRGKRKRNPHQGGEFSCAKSHHAGLAAGLKRTAPGGNTGQLVASQVSHQVKIQIRGAWSRRQAGDTSPVRRESWAWATGDSPAENKCVSWV